MDFKLCTLAAAHLIVAALVYYKPSKGENQKREEI